MKQTTMSDSREAAFELLAPFGVAPISEFVSVSHSSTVNGELVLQIGARWGEHCTRVHILLARAP